MNNQPLPERSRRVGKFGFDYAQPAKIFKILNS